MNGRKTFSLAGILAAITVVLILVGPGPAYAGVVATYTAPDGFKVVSYSRSWSGTAKLKSVYDELQRNTHGEEFKLLRQVNLYPGADPRGMAVAGRWYGVWTMKNNKPRLSGNRYIDIYNGDKQSTIEDIARTLAHEYGHHFTYYYYFKKENRLWDDWRNSSFAAVRKLKNNPKVSAEAQEHQWVVQEIAAEDYVELFGSPTAKKSHDFQDIAERLVSGQNQVSYSTDIYNFQPQENYQLPLAANLPGLRDYWLQAAGLPDRLGKAPAQVTVQLKEVNRPEHGSTPQYVFSWSKGAEDNTGSLEYTLVYFEKKAGVISELVPVKTITGSEQAEAVLGSAWNSRMYVWERVPQGLAFFVVYVKDRAGLVTASKVLAVDFSNPLQPKTVQIDDTALADGKWFPLTVKVDNRQLVFDVPPAIINGRTMVPLRKLFEELGAVVEWDAVTQTIRAVKNGKEVILQVGQPIASVDGVEIQLDASPLLRNGRTLVPVRFVSESLGAEVDWNQNLQLVTVTSY